MTLKKQTTVVISALLLTALLIISLFGFATRTHANPLRFPPAVASATATTTSTYFVAGTTATTTMATYDTYSNTGVSGVGGSTQAMDKASLLIQLAASSTSSILRTTFEYSQDGIDWYEDEIFVPATSGYTSIGQPTVYTWTANGTATSSKIVNVPTPLRYVRVRMRVEGANASVWAAIQPQKQNN